MQTRLQSTRVRVPPPPPRRREMHAAQDDDDDDIVHVAEHASPVATNPTGMGDDDSEQEEWLLRVRFPPGHSSSRSTVVSIHVTAEMTARTIAACLQQCMPHQQPVVGLFDESRTGHFYTLEHVLQTKEQDVVYTMQWTLPPPSSKSWYQKLNKGWLSFSLLPLCWILRSYLPILCYLLHDSTLWLYKGIIHIPLMELYRNGPWMVGWEGTPLPQICSRITYHGDEMFWSRNLDECQRIFLQKQDAWLRVARPLWWMVLVGFVFLLVRWLLASFRRPPPVNRDMVETYRAWQILLQQASKTFLQSQPLNERQGQM